MLITEIQILNNYYALLQESGQMWSGLLNWQTEIFENFVNKKK